MVSGTGPDDPDADGVRARRLEANDFLRKVAGGVAFELASTVEGRVASLSVEVWPERGVGLRVHKGHELRVFAEIRDGVVEVVWERSDPGPSPRRALTTRGSLGDVDAVEADDLRELMARWLSWRAQR